MAAAAATRAGSIFFFERRPAYTKAQLLRLSLLFTASVLGK
jgi:hypothetical protein